MSVTIHSLAVVQTLCCCALCLGAETATTGVEEALAKGAASLRKGDVRSAASFYDAAIRLNPREKRAQLGRSEVALRNHDLVGAMQSADEAIYLDRKSPDGFVVRARAEYEVGDADRAVAHCEEAIGLAPRCAVAQCGSRRGLRVRQDLEKASGDVAQARKLHPATR